MGFIERLRRGRDFLILNAGNGLLALDIYELHPRHITLIVSDPHDLEKSKELTAKLDEKVISYWTPGAMFPLYDTFICRLTGNNHNMFFEGHLDDPTDPSDPNRCKHEGKCEHKKKRPIEGLIYKFIKGKKALFLLYPDVEGKDRSVLQSMMAQAGLKSLDIEEFEVWYR